MSINLEPTEVVGEIPGNAEELSNLMESDPLLAEEIMYLSGGVEHYKNRNTRTNTNIIALSQEEFNLDLKSILEKIIKLLTNTIEDVFDGSAAISIGMARLLNRAEEVDVNSHSAARGKLKSSFKIETRIQNLSINYREISDPQGLLQALKLLHSVVQSVYTYLNVTVYNVFEEVVSFDPMSDDINKLANVMLNSSPIVLSSDPKFINKGLYIRSGYLLGNQTIVVENSRPGSSIYEQVIHQNLSLQPSDNDPKPIKDSITYPSFSKNLERAIIREVLSLAERIDNFNTLSRRSIRRSRLNIIRDRIAYLSRLLDTNEVNNLAASNIRQYVKLLEVYSGWIVNPYLGLIALCSRNMSAILNVCEANAK